MSATGENGSRSFLRYSGLAQAGRVSGFEQCADLRHPVVSDSPQAGNARITIVAASPALIVGGQRAKRPSSFYPGPLGLLTILRSDPCHTLLINNGHAGGARA